MPVLLWVEWAVLSQRLSKTRPETPRFHGRPNVINSTG
jgi:hypothetical protein